MKKLHITQKRIWFISYISLVLVCVLTGYIISELSAAVLNKQIDETVEYAFNSTVETVGNKLRAQQTSMYAVLQSSYVESLANKYSDFDNTTGREVVRHIIDEMHTQFFNNDFTEENLIVFLHKDIAVTNDGAMSHEDAFLQYMKKGWTDCDLWLEDIFSSKKMTDFCVFEDEAGRNFVAVIQKSIRNIGGQPSVVAISIISEKKFFSDIYGDASSKIYLFANGERILSTDSDAREKFDGESGKIIKHDGKRYIFMKTEVDAVEYVQLFAISKYASRLKGIKLTGYTVNLICLLLGIGLALYFTQINYRPIRRIASRFHVELEGKNEYVAIEKSLEKLLSNRHEAQKLISEKTRRLSETCTGLLLQAKSAEAVADIKKRFARTYPFEHFAVAEFKINSLGKMGDAAASAGENIRMACFAIENVFTELFTGKVKCDFSSFDSSCCCIMNFEESGELDNAYVCAEQVCSFLDTNFSMDIVCFISENGGLSDIGNLRCKTQALRFFEERMSGEIVFVYEDIPEYASVIYGNEYATALTGALNEGSRERACALLDKFFEEQFFGDMPSYMLQRCFEATLLDFYRINAGEDDVRLNGLVTALDKQDFALFRQRLTTAVNTFSRRGKNSEQISEEKIERIIGFIEKNYSNSDLNVSFLSDTFDISINHLSRFFKANTGEGPAEYILKYRCLKATELLKENPATTISDVSRMCGFYSAGSFIRAFKRIYGFTPGKYVQKGND